MAGITILRLPAVQQKTGLSRSSIYLRISKGDFPAPIPLGQHGHAVGWNFDAVEKWLTDQIGRQLDATARSRVA